MHANPLDRLRRLRLFEAAVGSRIAAVRWRQAWWGRDEALAFTWPGTGPGRVHVAAITHPLADVTLKAIKRPRENTVLERELSDAATREVVAAVEGSRFWIPPSHPKEAARQLSEYVICLLFKVPNRPEAVYDGYGTADDDDTMARMLDFFIALENHAPAIP